MQTREHKTHIAKRISYNDCQECRADRERSFLRSQWPGYQFVSDYLKWAQPRLVAIREGVDSVDARIWRRDFRRALHRRISLKISVESGRKYNDSYRERLKIALGGKDPNAVYLRHFAARGASTLR